MITSKEMSEIVHRLCDEVAEFSRGKSIGDFNKTEKLTWEAFKKCLALKEHLRKLEEKA